MLILVIFKNVLVTKASAFNNKIKYDKLLNIMFESPNYTRFILIFEDYTAMRSKSGNTQQCIAD